MIKALAASALLFAAATAQAEVHYFTVEYRGFDVNGTFDGNRSIPINFTVDDANNDGDYTFDELIRFAGPGFVYPGYCDDGPIASCVSAFHYKPGGAIDLTAMTHSTDNTVGAELVTGSHYRTWGNSNEYWQWTAQTQATIRGDIPAVPEPASYALFAAGAALLALRRRR